MKAFVLSVALLSIGFFTNAAPLAIRQTDSTISVYRLNTKIPILTQVVRANFRPFIHPLVAPDGKGLLTEYSPGHHKHQTGLYWGFTRVNGRDYFHHPEGSYWRRVSAKVLTTKGNNVKWETTYDLLDEAGKAVLTETQTWTMREEKGQYVLELEWNGEAKTDVTIGKYDYGGLFVRMPWYQGIEGDVLNTAKQKNERAEGQQAMWVDVGMKIKGRDDWAHIAVFDHPKNRNYPTPWRVDGQLGIGPARARKGDWTIKKGEVETIRHQILVYTGKRNDLELNKKFEKYTGDFSGYATASLWGVAQREALEAKFLTPDEAVKAMTVKEGFKVNTWASEPMMEQPMAFCWDDRGRLWVAENRDYESRGRGFSNNGNSRILILEDTNRDGVADSKKVFMEGLAFPAALAVGFDGVFVGAPPNLLFVPDRNHDDRADMDEIEVRLTGWGIRDRHETLNSFHWGPDGWLYGLQGFATPSKVRKPDGKGKLYRHKDPFPEEEIFKGNGTDINGGVWRYHPTKDRFEVVAHGFSNPWGVDFDAKGQMFITACVIPHLWHVIPGGIYHRQGGQHFNPYVYNDIKTIADHTHRSAHGGARVYLSDAFPKEEQGRIFMCNIHDHGVLSDVLVPKGSGFVGTDGDNFMLANNGQWVGFSMEIGPEGGLYALDWHDADICGKEVLNHETGRIFRIMPNTSSAENWAGRFDDLAKMTDAQLVNLQLSPSEWHARRARTILQFRASQGKLEANTQGSLRQLLDNTPNPDHRLRALWALHLTNGLTPDQFLTLLDNTDPYIRAWAVQLLCEDKIPSVAALAKMTQMARTNTSPVVRLYLASALQRMDAESAWKIATELVQHAEDANDHNLPKMIWFGLEPLVTTNPSRALEIAFQAKIPLVINHIGRRLTDANALEVVLSKLPKNFKPFSVQTSELLTGIRDALEGRSDVKTPANWKAAYQKLMLEKGKIAQLTNEISQHFGDAEATTRALATLKSSTSPLPQRQKALQSLATQQRPELLKELPNLLNDNGLRMDAIRAMAAFDHEPFGRLLLERYPKLTEIEKAEAIQTLAARPRYGWLLTQALKNSTVPKRDVPSYTARQLRRVVGSGFVEVWGPIDHVEFDQTAYNKYRRLLTDDAVLSANTTRGKAVFKRTCGLCHKMYGEGGIIGPDLTGSNRANLDYLLGNILDPSGEIQDDYKMVVVTTRNGRTYIGNVAKENDRQLTLRIVGQEAVVINKSDIQSREVNAASMMPTGLFDTLTDTEIKDLVKYMRTMDGGKTAKK
ncbi:MAG: PmoA family protein [Spirosomaceae bacterium]|jgi:putative membrane-bound dehydrogenase-like protein|nr:PmoA family protein [Spirosomataceae bacterium]